MKPTYKCVLLLKASNSLTQFFSLSVKGKRKLKICRDFLVVVNLVIPQTNHFNISGFSFSPPCRLLCTGSYLIRILLMMNEIGLLCITVNFSNSSGFACFSHARVFFLLHHLALINIESHYSSHVFTQVSLVQRVL